MGIPAEIIFNNESTNIPNVIKLFPNSPKPKTAMKKNIPHSAECVKSLDDIRKIQQYFLDKNDVRDYMMFTVGICTGFRVSDLCALDVGDIINEDGSFKESIDIVERKTGKRSVNRDDQCVITEAMVLAISKYLKKRKTYSLSDPLLYSRKSNADGERRMDERSCWRVLKQAQRDLRLDYNIGSHSMRKTFANIAACCGGKANVDMNKLIQVQHMLKHSDYKTTMRYLNLNSIFTQNARKNVSDFVLGKTRYNNISEALMQDEESSVVEKIFENLELLIERQEQEG